MFYKFTIEFSEAHYSVEKIGGEIALARHAGKDRTGIVSYPRGFALAFAKNKRSIRGGGHLDLS
jgi:hypothetical protein